MPAHLRMKTRREQVLAIWLVPKLNSMLTPHAVSPEGFRAVPQAVPSASTRQWVPQGWWKRTAATSAVRLGTNSQPEPSDTYELWQPMDIDDGVVKSIVAYNHEPWYTVSVGAGGKGDCTGGGKGGAGGRAGSCFCSRRLPKGQDAVRRAQRKTSKRSLLDQMPPHIMPIRGARPGEEGKAQGCRAVELYNR